MSPNLETEIFIETAVPPDITDSALADLLAFAFAAEGATGSWRIELVLTDDAMLRRLHHEFMGLDSPTDIMTFPDHDAEAGGPATGGQIYISAERAAEQAPEFGQSWSDEIRFLVLHGVLHLCGWDDTTDAKRERMLARQAELLREVTGAQG